MEICGWENQKGSSKSTIIDTHQFAHFISLILKTFEYENLEVSFFFQDMIFSMIFMIENVNIQKNLIRKVFIVSQLGSFHRQ